MTHHSDAGVVANERLTALSSSALLVALILILATTPNVPALLLPHVFIGVLLAGPLAVKLASVGYRFARYYTGSQSYVAKGPPRLALRLLAPFLVAVTIVLMVSGLALLATGPDDPGPFVALHNIAFIFWLPLFAVHALAYARRAFNATGRDMGTIAESVRGRGLRLSATGIALLLGSVAGAALLPGAVPWTVPGVLSQQLPAPVLVGSLVTLLTWTAIRPKRWS